jgi:hypothetical protein
MIRSIAFSLSLLSSAATFAQVLTPPVIVPGVGPVTGTVHINQPGVYGRIDIGQVAPPPVIYAQPMQIMPAPVAVVQRPVYLYVPPGHAKDWRHWCGHYHACGEPVYFVQEHWVKERYEAERHREWEHDHGRGHDEDHDHDRGRGHDHDD